MNAATRIVLKHRKYRGTHPYVCHGLGTETDTVCENFASAVRVAKEMGATSVTVHSEHAPSDAKLIAKNAGVELILT